MRLVQGGNCIKSPSVRKKQDVLIREIKVFNVKQAEVRRDIAKANKKKKVVP